MFIKRIEKKRKDSRKTNNQGQISIVVLLASAVILSLGLSASKRTTIETKIETDEQTLREVFNTAESAINQYLDGSINEQGEYFDSKDNKAKITTQEIGGKNDEHNTSNTFSLVSEGKVLANTNYFFWLVNHDENTDIGSTHYPSNVSVNLSVDNDFNGILKVDYFYIEGGEYKVSRQAYDFGSGLVDGDNIKGVINQNERPLSFALTGDPLLIVVTPILKATSLSLSGSFEFPLQGEEIISRSESGGGVKTQIKTRHIFQLPSFFLEAMTARNKIE